MHHICLVLALETYSYVHLRQLRYKSLQGILTKNSLWLVGSTPRCGEFILIGFSMPRRGERCLTSVVWLDCPRRGVKYGFWLHDSTQWFWPVVMTKRAFHSCAPTSDCSTTVGSPLLSSGCLTIMSAIGPRLGKMTPEDGIESDEIDGEARVFDSFVVLMSSSCGGRSACIDNRRWKQFDFDNIDLLSPK